MEFSQIALLLVVAALFGTVARILKQPLLVGYLFAGLILGGLKLVEGTEVFSGLGQIGVALLLFLVGLEMKIGEIPSIGKVAVISGMGQITFTSIVGFLLALLLGFSPLASVYIAVALTFSSTIIMVNLLSQKNDLDSLYGRISIGFLLVQDFVAVLILMFLASLGRGDFSVGSFILVATKALLLFVSVWSLSKKALPYIFERFIAVSPQLLFVGSIAWALGIASLVAGPLGFTLEIGGFLAGIALSNVHEHLQISARTRPLRDFFLTIFFLLLGTKLVASGISGVIIPATIFSAFVLIGNPIIVLIILGLMGYKKRTSFFAGLTVAQISEFSFILIAMGVGLGHLSQTHTALVVLVGIITMTISTYLILGAEKIYKRIKGKLSIFEKKNTVESVYVKERPFTDHVVVVGSGRTGKILLPFLTRKKIPFFVIDFDPTVYKRLNADNIPVIFGDISDDEVLKAARIERSLLTISTISDLESNLSILEHIRRSTRRPASLFTAKSKKEAILYYEKGATYVVVPQTITGEFIRHLFLTYGISETRLKKLGSGHFSRLLKHS